SVEPHLRRLCPNAAETRTLCLLVRILREVADRGAAPRGYPPKIPTRERAGAGAPAEAGVPSLGPPDGQTRRRGSLRRDRLRPGRHPRIALRTAEGRRAAIAVL